MHIEKNEQLLHAYKYILDFYYGEVSVDTILSFDAIKSDGFTIDSIPIVSEQIGLVSITKDIKASEIPNHFLPCIIIDDDEQAIIYKKNIANKKIEIYDVNIKQSSEISLRDLSKYKKAVLIFREEAKKELLEQDINNDWFWKPVRSFWRSYIEVGVLTFFINIFALFVPLFIMIVYDRVVPNQAYETLFVLSIGLIIVLIFELVFKSVRNHIIDKTGKNFHFILKKNL